MKLEAMLQSLDQVLGLDAASQADVAAAQQELAVAAAEMSADRPVQAESACRSAVARLERHLGTGSYMVAESYVPFAESMRKQNRYHAAEQLMRESMASIDEAFGERHALVTEPHLFLGWYLQTQGDLAGAQEVLEDGVAIARETLGDDHPILPRLLNNLNVVYRFQRLPEKALVAARDGYELAVKTRGAHDPSTYTVRLNLALSYGEVGDFAAAAQIYDEIGAECGEDFVGTDREGTCITVMDYRAYLEYKLGNFARSDSLMKLVLENQRMHRPVSGLVVFSLRRLAWNRVAGGDLTAAEALYAEAADVFEETRTQMQAGIRRATFRKTPYQGLAAVRLELGKEIAAWEAVEMSRARVLSDVLLDEDALPPSMSEVQQRLTPETAVVGWMDFRTRQDAPSFWAYVIRDTGHIRWERLPIPDGLDELGLRNELKAYVDSYRQAVAPAVGSPLYDDSESRRLFETRFEPIVEHLEGVSSLVVVPSAAMSGVPIEAFTDRDGRQLVDQFDVTYAPSLAVWNHLADDAGLGDLASGLLVGDPPFRPGHVEDSSPLLASFESVMRGAIEGDEASLSNLPRLQRSRSEVRQIAAYLKEPTVLVGKQATEAALAEMAKAGRLQEFDVVHVASHALIHDQKPERSLLVLSQVDDSSDEDGLLKATEIEQWNLDARLVTLSACRTAAGRAVWGEGNVSLTYPFLMAGAKAVLVSLWEVDDRATELFMTRFYGNLLGDSPGSVAPGDLARALQEAKHWLRDFEDAQGDRPYEHPCYWSAFVLVGAG